MIQVYGSLNSRYFVVRNGENITLYRVPAVLWSRDLPGLKEVLQVSDRGDIFYRSAEGLCRIASAPKSEPEKVVWEAMLRGYRPQGELGKVVFNLTGTEMVGEIVTAESSLSDGFWKLFRRSESDDEDSRFKGYELVRVGEANERLRTFPRKYVDTRDGSRYLWTVSPECNYMAMVTCVKRREGVVEVYRFAQEGKWCSFVVRDAEILNLYVDNAGRAAIWARVAGKKCVLIQEPGHPMISISAPEKARFMHFWKRNVCWMTDDALEIADFSGKVLVSASLEPLKELGIEYRFFFNYLNEIDLITVSGKELYLTRIDPENLAIDAKRWNNVARYKREISVEKVEKKRREQEEAEARLREHEKLSQELSDCLVSIVKGGKDKEEQSLGLETNLIKSAEQLKEQTVRSRARVVADIKDNRTQFYAGRISREDYLARLEELNAEMLAISSPI